MKKILAVVVAMVMVLGMVGCGKVETSSMPSSEMQKDEAFFTSHSVDKTGNKSYETDKKEKDIVSVEVKSYNITNDMGDDEIEVIFTHPNDSSVTFTEKINPIKSRGFTVEFECTFYSDLSASIVRTETYNN